MAPPVRLELTTYRLTAGCSTTELQGNVIQLAFHISDFALSFNILHLTNASDNWKLLNQFIREL